MLFGPMKNEPLWRVWWLWGLALALATAGLIVAADNVRDAGHQRWGDVLDLARLALYWAWLMRVWKCSRNVGNPVWTPLARVAVVLGLVANALA